MSSLMLIVMARCFSSWYVALARFRLQFSARYDVFLLSSILWDYVVIRRRDLLILRRQWQSVSNAFLHVGSFDSRIACIIR